MDQHAVLRSLPFRSVAEALGADLSKFKLRKAGREWYGPCPVHAPKTNTTSFSYLDDGRFFCFSCQAKGRGAIDLIKQIRNINFTQAVEFLAPLAATVPILPAKEKQPAEAVDGGGELKPFTGKYAKYAVENDWVNSRVPDAEIRQRYGVIFYSNPARKSKIDNHVLIPIKDVEGVQYGWLTRNPTPQGGQPKYVFPAGLPKSRFLFGAHELSQAYQLPVRFVYLVESPFAVMKFASLKLPAVSPFGWSVSEDQLKLLKLLCRAVVFLPDKNRRREALAQAGEVASALWFRCPDFPTEDPEYLSREQILALTAG